MRRGLLAVLILAAVVGCNQSPEEPAPTPPDQGAATAEAPPSAAGSGSGGPHIIGSAPGLHSPVVGTEGLQGGGGGNVGQAAKDQTRDVLGRVGGGSLGQSEPE